MIRLLNRKILVPLVALVLVLGIGFGLVVPHRTGDRTVTAYFSQAVSLFPGTDVDIMGVPVGKVTSVTPQGDQVKVVMQYADQYQLPAGVKAAIVTPTLIADRFVQLAPAYTGGDALPDGGEIPMARTAVPVEMDQIYKSLSDLTGALGPNGANKHGALAQLLASSAKALKGNGKLGNRMIANLSQAAKTLGSNSGPLFKTLDSLASVSSTLQHNDATVQRFMTHLSQASTQLAGQRGNLKRALDAIADAVTTTRSFVADNKDAVVGDLKSLNTTLSVLARDRQTLGKVIQLAPLGLGDLTDAWDFKTHTEGIRLQVGPTAADLPDILCTIVVNDKVPNSGAVCNLFKALLPGTVTSDVGQQITGAGVHLPSVTQPSLPSLPSPPSGTTQQAPSSLGGLLGAVQQLAGGSK